eukprot:15201598-Alexandrium_andersonii.AAC.1
MAAWTPDLLVGVGQGALVALLTADPRAVEAALVSKTVVDPAECRRLALAWSGLRGVLLLRPR